MLSQAGNGRGQVAALVGEAGVGKSRLTYEFTHSHRVEDWLILEASSVSRRSVVKTCRNPRSLRAPSFEGREVYGLRPQPLVG